MQNTTGDLVLVLKFQRGTYQEKDPGNEEVSCTNKPQFVEVGKQHSEPRHSTLICKTEHN